jgi:acyl-coenzyme A synthetase/AMP-(fatty) acid ligase
VPSLYRRILKYGALGSDALRTLRHGLTAGEALPPAVLEAWTQATGTLLYEALGMTEISTYVSTGPGVPIKPGSPGRPQPGRRIAILAAEEGSPRELPTVEIGRLAVTTATSGSTAAATTSSIR